MSRWVILNCSNNLSSLGVVGGTFDPIHYGHLNPVKEAAKLLGLKQVHFVPVAIPPHRSKPVAGAQHRLAMLKLALKDYPGFKSDDRELRREGNSYTVNTLESFREEFGKDISIMMFIGADVFSAFNTWHQWQTIPDLAHIIVISRPDYPTVDLSTLGNAPNWKECNHVDQLYEQPHGLVLFQTVTPVDISATTIRLLLASGKQDDVELQQALPSAVYDYINKHNLYTSQTRETECYQKN